MSIWPYWPVWPFLLALAVVCSFWNWRASAAIAAAIIGVQLIKGLGLPQTQILYFGFYVALGFVTFTLFNKIAGAFLTAIGLVYLFHILGYIPHYPKIIITEFILVVGLFIGVSDGGNGKGILDMHRIPFGSYGLRSDRVTVQPSEMVEAETGKVAD